MKALQRCVVPPEIQCISCNEDGITDWTCDLDGALDKLQVAGENVQNAFRSMQSFKAFPKRTREESSASGRQAEK